MNDLQQPVDLFRNANGTTTDHLVFLPVAGSPYVVLHADGSRSEASSLVEAAYAAVAKGQLSEGLSSVEVRYPEGGRKRWSDVVDFAQYAAGR